MNKEERIKAFGEEKLRQSEMDSDVMTTMLSELEKGVGKSVIFNVGKEKIYGELISVNKRYMTATLRVEKEGKIFRATIRLNKVSSFMVEE